MQNSGLSEFINLSLYSVLLLAIFLLSALALLTVFTFLNKRDEDFGWMAAISLGLGPALMGWFFTMLLWLLPKQEPYVYIWTIVIICVVISLLRPRYIFLKVKEVIYAHFTKFDVWQTKTIVLVAIFILVLILLGYVLIGLFLPIFGNDPSEYAQAARLIAQERDISIYPFVDSSKFGGFYSPLTHPLGYINLMTFGYMLQGSTDSAGIIKMINPYFVIASVIAIWSFAARKIALAGPIAALILISTPLYFEVSAKAHIDTMRIYTYMVAFFALYYHIKKPNFVTAIIVGLAVGMAHFTHSIGILTLPILIPIYLIVSGLSLKRTFLYLGTIIIIGLALIAPRWSINLATFGSIVADQVKVWSIPEVYFDEYLAAVRQLTTPLDKVFYGILKGFSYPEQFGLSYYIFALVVFWLVIKTRVHKNIKLIWQKKLFIKPDVVVFSLWVLAGYYGIVSLSAVLGMDLIIKNARYLLTVQPFIAIVVACILAELFISSLPRQSEKILPEQNIGRTKNDS